MGQGNWIHQMLRLSFMRWLKLKPVYSHQSWMWAPGLYWSDVIALLITWPRQPIRFILRPVTCAYDRSKFTRHRHLLFIFWLLGWVGQFDWAVLALVGSFPQDLCGHRTSTLSGVRFWNKHTVWISVGHVWGRESGSGQRCCRMNAWLIPLFAGSVLFYRSLHWLVIHLLIIVAFRADSMKLSESLGFLSNRLRRVCSILCL